MEKLEINIKNDELKKVLAISEMRINKLERDNDKLTQTLTVSETQIKALEVERNNLSKLVEIALGQKTTQIIWKKILLLRALLIVEYKLLATTLRQSYRFHNSKPRT